MKKLVLSITAVSVSLLSLAQIPTNGLVFGLTCNGNYNDISTTNAVAVSNTASLGNDSCGSASSASSHSLGSTTKYALATYPVLKAGATNGQLTMSCRVKLGLGYQTLAGSQYITIMQNGESYIRYFKNSIGQYRIEAGIFNGISYNFGYYEVKTSFANQPIDPFKWQTITAVYSYNSASSLELFLDGISLASGSTLNAFYPVEYGANDSLIIGKKTSATNSFSGSLDNVLIYNRDLSAAEVAGLSIACTPSLNPVFELNYNGNFTDTSITNAVPTYNTANLGIDSCGTVFSAGSYGYDVATKYSLATYPSLQAGSTNATITMSCRVKLDLRYQTSYNNTYINIMQNGENYIRYFKNGQGEFVMEGVVYNNNPTGGSFGYLVASAFQSITPFNPFAWNTLTMVYKPNNTQSTSTLYINGVPVNFSAIQSINNIVYNATTDSLIMGKRTTAVGSFAGTIDNVLIYNRALSDTEVDSLIIDCTAATVATKKINSSRLVAIYPNPANSYVTIVGENIVGNVSITNLIGETVYKATVTSNETKIDVSNLTNGMYFITTNGVTQKFIKE